jgi:hypothetical protein
MRERGGWTKRAEAELAGIRAVLADLADYWPVTLRQVYYRLVAAGTIENNRGAYGKLSRTLTKARLDGLVPWAALEDRARSTLVSDGWADRGEFVEAEVDDFLTGYRRDLLQGQPWRPELWVEKDALSRVCHRAAFPYCVPVIVARGFSSVSYVHEAAERIHHRAAEGQRTRILYFGDLDPSGFEMLPAMMQTLTAEMNCAGLVEAQRCALTPEQVESYRLPKNPDALKDTDTRAAKYRERFGDLAVELDALPPATLAGIVEANIRECLDLSLFEAEQTNEAAESAALTDLRDRVLQIVGAES